MAGLEALATAGRSAPTVDGTSSADAGNNSDAGNLADAGTSTDASEAGHRGTDGGARAARAADFVDSIGANTHVAFGVAPYDDVSKVGQALAYAGIRHVRDGIDGPSADLAKYQTLVTMGIGLDLDTTTEPADIPMLIAAYEQVAAMGLHAFDAIEGWNEISANPVIYMGQTSGLTTTFQPAADAMKALYQAVHADPKLQGIPVYDLTYGGAEPDNVGLQFLAGFADVANVHCYTAGGAQLGIPVDDFAYQLYVNYTQTWGTTAYAGMANPRPKVITETGYPTNPGTAGSASVDEPTQATELLDGAFLFTPSRRPLLIRAPIRHPSRPTPLLTPSPDCHRPVAPCSSRSPTAPSSSWSGMRRSSGTEPRRRPSPRARRRSRSTSALVPDGRGLRSDDRRDAREHGL